MPRRHFGIPTRTQSLCTCGCGKLGSYAPYQGHPARFCGGHILPPHAYLSDFYAVNPESGCWEWTWKINKHGYGLICTEGRAWVAHRYVYTHIKGDVVASLDLDHLCRNRKCVNPDHLEPVTRSVNLQRSPRTKLTVEIVRAIRASTERTAVLARRYGVSPRTLYNARYGIRWQNVE